MNNKIRIYDLARKLGKSNKELIAVLQQLDIPVKSHSSSIDEETARIVENIINEEAEPQSQEPEPKPSMNQVQPREKKPEKKLGMLSEKSSKKLSKPSFLAHAAQRCCSVASPLMMRLIWVVACALEQF